MEATSILPLIMLMWTLNKGSRSNDWLWLFLLMPSLFNVLKGFGAINAAAGSLADVNANFPATLNPLPELFKPLTESLVKAGAQTGMETAQKVSITLDQMKNLFSVSLPQPVEGGFRLDAGPINKVINSGVPWQPVEKSTLYTPPVPGGIVFDNPETGGLRTIVNPVAPPIQGSREWQDLISQ